MGTAIDDARGAQRFRVTVVFSHDGRRILTASYDKTVRIWDAGTGDLIKVLYGHTDFVFSAVYSPDGRHILTSSLDKTARIWDAATFELVQTINAGTVGTTGLQGAAYSSDGRFIVGGVDKDARIWDAETGKLVAVLGGEHTLTVLGGEFSPDGRHAVTTSLDGTLKIWDVAAGKALLTGYLGGVASAIYSPDGRSIVAALDDGTIRFWDARVVQTDIVLPHNDVVRSAASVPTARAS